MAAVQLPHIEKTDALALFRKITRRAVFSTLGKEVNPLDAWIRLVDDACRTTKEKGDLFELLCLRYLQDVQGMQAWLLAELPAELRQKLGLGPRDLGIDIIAEDQTGHHAVQAKFRGRAKVGRRNPRTGQIEGVQVTWKELSTFVALANRSGPYSSHMVVTTADGARWPRQKATTPGAPRERTLAYRTLREAPGDFWRTLAQLEGRPLGADPAEKESTEAEKGMARVRRELSPEELREKRLAALAPLDTPPGPTPFEAREGSSGLAIPDDDPLWAELGLGPPGGQDRPAPH